MTEYDEEIVEWLKRSREIIGELEPVIATPDGEIIDGKHRLKAYPGWKTVTVEAEELDKIVQRIHRNIHRKMSRAETKQAIIQLALALEKKGIPKDSLIDEIKKYTPFSEDYIRSLLPAKYKREYKKKEKPPVKILYPETKAKPETPKPEAPKTVPTYLCPVCGTKLKLVGNLLEVA